jgi:hypothetical protein
MGATDRAKSAFELVVNRLMSKYDYSGTFAYVVTHQNGDGTLELKPEDPKLSPPLSNVDILYETPASKVVVRKGAVCRVHFVNRDPRRPEAFGFRQGDFQTLDFGVDGFGLARQGDLTLTGGLGLMITLGNPPGGSPPLPVLTGTPMPAFICTVADYALDPVAAMIGGTWPGYILTGSTKVKSQ